MLRSFIVACVIACGLLVAPVSAGGWCPLGYDSDGIAYWRKLFNAISSVFQGDPGSCMMAAGKSYKQ